MVQIYSWGFYHVGSGPGIPVQTRVDNWQSQAITLYRHRHAATPARFRDPYIAARYQAFSCAPCVTIMLASAFTLDFLNTQSYAFRVCQQVLIHGG